MVEKRCGTLYGVGVGPGDPDLICIKAVKVLNGVSVIFAPFSTKNSYSIAKRIIKSHIKEDIPIKRLEFPMSKRHCDLEHAWRKNTDIVLPYLDRGEDVALITLGDPLIYSTFGYILLTLKSLRPDIDIKIIPGISSYQASAAFVQTPLVKGDECLSIVSGTADMEKIKNIIQASNTSVILKPYKNYREIIELLKQMGMLARSFLIIKCGLDGEEVIKSLEEVDSIPYLSLIIVNP